MFILHKQTKRHKHKMNGHQAIGTESTAFFLFLILSFKLPWLLKTMMLLVARLNNWVMD